MSQGFTKLEITLTVLLLAAFSAWAYPRYMQARHDYQQQHPDYRLYAAPLSPAPVDAPH